MAPDENAPAGQDSAGGEGYAHPETIGKCTIISKIGQGGMGVVYKGKHTDLDIDVAVKVLPPHLAERADMAGRFLREARLAVRINHPEIVRVLDCGREEGRHYLVMEYVDGNSLQEQIDESGPVPAGRALEIALSVANALNAAQEQVGIIHRDIKPDNIMMTKDGHVKVADLGLAKVVADHTEAQMTGATASGVAMGTPYYMAPEQFMDAKSVDLRADIFALGATLYHMLTGKRPFEGDSVYQILRQIEQTEPEPLKDSTPEPLKDLVARMLAKRADDRYQSYSELVADIRNAQAAVEAGGLSGTYMGLAEVPHDAKVTRRKPKTAPAGKPKTGTQPTLAADQVGMTMSMYEVTVKRNPVAWIGGGVVLAGVVIAIVLWALLAGRRREPAPVPVVATRDDTKEDELKAGAEAEAEAFYKALLARLEEGKLEEARLALKESKDRHGGSRYAADIDELADRVASKLEERRKSIEGALAAADEKEKAGDVAAAAEEIKAALALEDIPGLRARLAALEKKMEALKLAEAAGRLFEKGDWKGALGKYEDALENVDEKHRPEIEARIAAARERLRIAEAEARIRRDAAAARWRAVYDGVEKARAEGITSAKLEEFGRDARRRLAPKNELTGPLGMEFVYIPGGAFRMGSTSGERDERPVRQVTVASLYIGRHEVTAAEFEAFRRGLKAKPSVRGEAGSKPAASVSWFQAVEFCKYLSSLEAGRAAYRLPREAEWEYAARGTAGRAYPWGEVRITPDRANVAGEEDGFKQAAPVGSFEKGATPEGVFDLAGNVAEWCADWYGAYGTAPETDPIGPMNGTQRVVRGGAFTFDAGWARGAARGSRDPSKGAYVVGFRVLRELTADERRFEGPAAGDR